MGTGVNGRCDQPYAPSPPNTMTRGSNQSQRRLAETGRVRAGAEELMRSVWAGAMRGPVWKRWRKNELALSGATALRPLEQPVVPVMEPPTRG